jgi:hypothetical protein
VEHAVADPDVDMMASDSRDTWFKRSNRGLLYLARTVVNELDVAAIDLVR